MKKVSVIIVLLTVMGSLCAQEKQAEILEAHGTVELQDGASAEWRAAAPGDTLEKHTVISTGFRSTALISLGDSFLSIRPLTRLALEELVQKDNVEETRLYLRTGRVRAEVKSPEGVRADFTVRSPIATASVRGTSFEFDTLHLYVNEGLVRMESGSGQVVYVDEGQRSYVDESNQRMIPPFEAEAALLTPAFSDLANTAAESHGRDYAPPPAPGLPDLPDLPDLSPLNIETGWD
jgi:hypothetical protein